MLPICAAKPVEQKNQLRMSKFIVSVKRSEHGSLVVVTDIEIIGRKFEEGKLQLDLTKDFYKGDEKNIIEVEKDLLYARHVHFTGEKSVSLGIKLGLIDKNKVLLVNKIPHAQAVVEN